MEENPVMQRMDAVDPSISRTLRAEAFLEVAAEAILEVAAQTESLFDQDSEVESESVQEFFDDEVLLSSLNPTNPILVVMNEVVEVEVAIEGNESTPVVDDDVLVDDVLADWEKTALIDTNTASGTSSDAPTTSRHYRRSAKVWSSFQASISSLKHNLPSKDLYLPRAPDDFVNR